MSITELICIALLVYGGVMGFKNGLVKELASTAGFFIGLFIAYNYYESLGGGALMFIAIWIIVPILLGMVASLFTKVLDFTIVGGILNRILGALLGAGKWGVLILCLKLMVDKVNEWKTLLETL